MVTMLLLYAPMVSGFYAYARTQGIRVGKFYPFSPAFVLDMFRAWSSGESHPMWSWLVLVPAALGLALGGRMNPLFTASWILALVIGMFVPAVTRTFTFHRYYAFALPGFYLFAALGLDLISMRLKSSRGLYSVLAALLILIMAARLIPYYRYGLQGLRPAAEWIRQHRPNAGVLAVGTVSDAFRYYFPSARPMDQGLIPTVPRGAVVVMSYPSTMQKQDLEFLAERCQPPQVFPSALGEDLVVRVYTCD